MRITPITASEFRADGGAMFGLVPKPIWSKMIPANERNGIQQHGNSLLVSTDDGKLVLIDTGCGSSDDFSPRERELSGLEKGWPLADALVDHHLQADDIDAVILTHLHWDHAGGLANTVDGSLRLTFPRATYYVHSDEWSDALSRNPLLYKSYPERIRSALDLISTDRLVLIEEESAEVFPGIRMTRSGGHTRGHAMIELTSESITVDHPSQDSLGKVKRVLFPGDVCPTQHHLRMVFQTAYDTAPLKTREWKTHWLARAAEESIPIFFCHDPEIFAATIRADERREFIPVSVMSK